MKLMKKIALLGAQGLLGTQLCRYLNSSYTLYALSKTALDITSSTALKKQLAHLAPDIVINCAAYLGPDRCEENPNSSYAVNYQGVLNLVDAIKQINPNITLTIFSTDFVFDGKKGDYTEKDIPNPLGTYAIHKWASEEALLRSSLENFYIFRIASVLGPESERPDFSKAIIKNYKKHGKLNVINDMSISLSASDFVAQLVYKAFSKNISSGLYHCVATGKTTWFDVAKEILRLSNLGDQIFPCKHDQYPTVARRPMHANLINEKLSHALGEEIPSWQVLLKHLFRQQGKT